MAFHCLPLALVDLSPFTDLPEPGVCCQPGSHLRNFVPDGHMGLLLCWWVPEEPQTLPDLQRQRFPACKPPAQITQLSRELAGVSIPKSHTLIHIHTHWTLSEHACSLLIRILNLNPRVGMGTLHVWTGSFPIAHTWELIPVLNMTNFGYFCANLFQIFNNKI